MKRKTLLLYAVLGIAPASAAAGGALSLTLEECLEMAGRSNRALLAAKEQIKEAEKGRLSAAGNFLPSVSAGGSFTRIDENRGGASLLPGAYAGTDNYVLTGSVQVPLFTGFRNRAIYKSSDAGVEIQNENYRRVLNDLRLSITEAFYNSLLAEQLVELNRESELRLEKHLKQTRTLFANGLASRLDLLRSEVQLSNLRPQIIQAENNLRKARASLALLIGLDTSGANRLTPRGRLQFSETVADLEGSIARALSIRPEIRIAELRKDAAAHSVTAARSASFPQVSAAYNQRIEHPYRLQDNWGDSWNAMLNVSLPIFRGFSTRADTAQARSRLAQAELEADQLRENVRLQVENAYYGLIQEKETISALKKNVEQAGEALDIAQARYRSGLITNLEFMDTELSYMQAQMNLLRSQADYIIAVSRLRQAAGGE